MLASLGHLVGLLVKQIEISPFSSLSLFFNFLNAFGGTGLTTLLACGGCAWTALYSK